MQFSPTRSAFPKLMGTGDRQYTYIETAPCPWHCSGPDGYGLRAPPPVCPLLFERQPRPPVPCLTGLPRTDLSDTLLLCGFVTATLVALPPDCLTCACPAASCSSWKQSVRYVYQPLEEELILVMITNRSSNIVEDLETLRLLGRIVSHYCPNMDEEEVVSSIFDLFFAFDEVLSMGHRENTTLDQVLYCVEMESQEEIMKDLKKQDQIQKAQAHAAKVAKEIDKEKRAGTHRITGIGSGDMGFGGDVSTFGGGGGGGGISSGVAESPSFPKAPAPSSAPKKGGMRLGGARGGGDKVSKMLASGELEGSTASSAFGAGAAAEAAPAVAQDAVHIKMIEQFSAYCGREGNVESVSVTGDIVLCVADSSVGMLRINLNKQSNPNYTWKSHPQINRVAFNQDRILTMKDPSKPFPAGQDLAILKWRLANTSAVSVPLTITCWPSDNSANIEYEIADDYSGPLNNVQIFIPTTSSPTIDSAETGEATLVVNPQRGVLWQISTISAEHGTLELSSESNFSPDEFFPIVVAFTLDAPFAGTQINDVVSVSNGMSQPHSKEKLCCEIDEAAAESAGLRSRIKTHSSCPNCKKLAKEVAKISAEMLKGTISKRDSFKETNKKLEQDLQSLRKSAAKPSSTKQHNHSDHHISQSHHRGGSNYAQQPMQPQPAQPQPALDLASTASIALNTGGQFTFSVTGHPPPEKRSRSRSPPRGSGGTKGDCEKKKKRKKKRINPDVELA
eukprot:gene7276-1300_t